MQFKRRMVNLKKVGKRMKIFGLVTIESSLCYILEMGELDLAGLPHLSGSRVDIGADEAAGGKR